MRWQTFFFACKSFFWAIQLQKVFLMTFKTSKHYYFNPNPIHRNNYWLVDSDRNTVTCVITIYIPSHSPNFPTESEISSELNRFECKKNIFSFHSHDKGMPDRPNSSLKSQNCFIIIQIIPEFWSSMLQYWPNCKKSKCQPLSINSQAQHVNQHRWHHNVSELYPFMDGSAKLPSVNQAPSPGIIWPA